jgi:predicted ferric reductase
MFLFIPVVTGSVNAITGGRRIDKSILEPLIRKKEIRNTAVYICGPDLMRKSVVKELKSSGIASGNIYWEKFSF